MRHFWACVSGTVRIWHANTYRLESTLNYGLERVWTIACQKGSNNVALGYDEGSIIIKVTLNVSISFVHMLEFLLLFFFRFAFLCWSSPFISFSFSSSSSSSSSFFFLLFFPFISSSFYLSLSPSLPLFPLVLVGFSICPFLLHLIFFI